MGSAGARCILTGALQMKSCFENRLQRGKPLWQQEAPVRSLRKGPNLACFQPVLGTRQNPMPGEWRPLKDVSSSERQSNHVPPTGLIHTGFASPS